MIEFATLFLALVLGQQTVEVVASSSVAMVEIRLDDQIVARLEEPPWRVEIDFGEDLLPHELVATAWDEFGRKLGDTRQWVNFARGLVEARLAFDSGEPWPPKEARLYWQSFDGSKPLETKVLFDGQELDLVDHSRIDLPSYDPSIPHSLEAHLFFASRLEASADLIFGGVYGERISSDLTAVPVILGNDKRPGSPEAMEPWFQAHGVEVPVFSSDRKGQVIYVVRDRNLPKNLPLTIGDLLSSGQTSRKRISRGGELIFVSSSPEYELDKGQMTAIFKPYEIKGKWRRKGLARALSRISGPKSAQKADQRLFDATAVAGKLASQSGKARAVILMMDLTTLDQSQLHLVDVVTYLESLRVPFFVWLFPSPGAIETSQDDARLSTDLKSVARAVEESIGSQEVIWFEGSFLPAQIVLTSKAPSHVKFAH